jgi:hypothetical protein
MPQKAHVTSLEALESFRAQLIVYISQARPALDEVSADVARVRLWLENDQRTHWEDQMRRRTKEVEQAQQALFSARLSILRQENSTEQLLLQRAKRALEGADTKLKIVKKWKREYEGRVQPLLKQMEKLHSVLSNDMVKAVAYLTQTISTLAEYAEVHRAPNMVQATIPNRQEAATQAPDGQANRLKAGEIK